MTSTIYSLRRAFALTSILATSAATASEIGVVQSSGDFGAVATRVEFSNHGAQTQIFPNLTLFAGGSPFQHLASNLTDGQEVGIYRTSTMNADEVQIHLYRDLWISAGSFSSSATVNVNDNTISIDSTHAPPDFNDILPQALANLQGIAHISGLAPGTYTVNWTTRAPELGADVVTTTTTFAVPEPSACALGGIAFLVVALASRRSLLGSRRLRDLDEATGRWQLCLGKENSHRQGQGGCVSAFP